MVTASNDLVDLKVVATDQPNRAELAWSSVRSPTQSSAVFKVSGETVRVALVPNTEFVPRDPQTANEYNAAVKVMSEAARLTQSLADRLMDPLDGKTIGLVRGIIEHRTALPAQLTTKLDGYLYRILSAGGAIDCVSGAVIIPPVPREALATALANVPELQHPHFDLATVLTHLYDPRPSIGQGHFVFKARSDWDHFCEAVEAHHPKIARTTAELRSIFETAIATGDISPAELSTYETLSREILTAQEATLEDLLAKAHGAFDPCTRVYIEIRPGLAPEITVVPYSGEFRAELTRLSGHLLTAENLLPAEATPLRELIKSQVGWCLAPSTTPQWGLPSEAWIDTTHSNTVLDVQFNCGEMVALVGEKRNFQLIIAQYLPAEEVRAQGFDLPPTSFPHGFGSPEVQTPFLRLLDSAGAARYGAASREESITPVAPRENALGSAEQTVEFIKRPVFVNVVPLGVTHAMASLREIPPTLIDELARASIIADSLKAANTADSDARYISGLPGDIAAHAYVIAGAVGNATRYDPATAQLVLNILAGYEALLALRSGGAGALERATLGVLQELERRGVLTVDVSSGEFKITAFDPVKLREIAVRLQHQLQLWQLGIPLSLQKTLLDRANLDLSVASMGLAFARDLDQITRRRLREEARPEIEGWCDPQTLAPICQKLTALLDTAPLERIVAEVPSDPALRTLIRTSERPPGDE
jgi:hypothetical protein